jgi:hypothetical protein
MNHTENHTLTEMFTAYKRAGYNFCDETNTLRYQSYDHINLCADKAFKEWEWAKGEIATKQYHRKVNMSLNSASI